MDQLWYPQQPNPERHTHDMVPTCGSHGCTPPFHQTAVSLLNPNKCLATTNVPILPAHFSPRSRYKFKSSATANGSPCGLCSFLSLSGERNEIIMHRHLHDSEAKLSHVAKLDCVLQFFSRADFCLFSCRSQVHRDWVTLFTPTASPLMFIRNLSIRNQPSAVNNH